MSEATNFTVCFWGVRGSIACPGEDTVRYGGNTSCLEVRCGGHLFIFDAGTGIRRLGHKLAGEAPLDFDLFFSHTHYDHISGMPFFGPLYDRRNIVRMWAGHLGPDRSLKSVVQDLMTAPLFPVPFEAFAADCSFQQFAPRDTLNPRPGVVLRTAPLNHPNGACGYRVDYGGRSLCYVTDTEHRLGARDANIVDLVRNADVLIYDSTYTDEEYKRYAGWGHSTWQECCRIADAAGVRQAVLFHHEPGHDDAFMDGVAREAGALRPGTVVAREGMTIHL